MFSIVGDEPPSKLMTEPTDITRPLMTGLPLESVKSSVAPLRVGLFRVGEPLLKVTVLSAAVRGPDPSPVSVPTVNVVPVTYVPSE
jgi:hypothetical protein